MSVQFASYEELRAALASAVTSAAPPARSPSARSDPRAAEPSSSPSSHGGLVEGNWKRAPALKGSGLLAAASPPLDGDDRPGGDSGPQGVASGVISSLKDGPLAGLLCGAAAGGLAKVLTMPFDVTKRRMQVGMAPEDFRRAMGISPSQAQTEGLLNFAPTNSVSSPPNGMGTGVSNKHLGGDVTSACSASNRGSMAAQAGTPGVAKNSESSNGGKYVARRGADVHAHTQHIGKGSVVSAWSDGAKTNTRGDSAGIRGMAALMSTIVKEEGLRGLFRGSAPAVLKTSLSSGISFALFEFFSNRLLGSRCC
mmetsp:Transcript_20779/g.57236  ORF Transcript_20779/g.57236 Transcript_20779/m.57236 type:complete len:310 (-) Transcript_20779:406-1335(-)